MSIRDIATRKAERTPSVSGDIAGLMHMHGSGGQRQTQ